MIKKFTIENLNDSCSEVFALNDDLNVFSGKNGSGKTTLLKAMWYVISGNIKTLVDEIIFKSVRLDFTNGDYIEVRVNQVDNDKTVKINSNDNYPMFEHEFHASQLDDILFLIPEKLNSLFFPTFRRIEGGFATTSKFKRARFSSKESLIDVLETISKDLSHQSEDTEHKFVTSISTSDINSFLTNKYSKMSVEIRKIEDSQSQKILSVVSNSKDKEQQSLDDIREIVRETDNERNLILKPFSTLSTFVDKIFRDKAIQISNNIVLGKSKNIISSDNLSAGEKQMLSFLCYNFFYDNAVIFIDEPELSLHTDWQRILFPTLLKQGKKNQFIIATHSPFIYSTYPDKEIVLDEDKGDQNE